MYPIYYVALIKLELWFYPKHFDTLNYIIFINKVQITLEFQYSVVSSFIDSGAGLVLSIWFALALVLNSENNFITAKLTIWVWCGVAIMNRQIIYVFTNAC